MNQKSIMKNVIFPIIILAFAFEVLTLVPIVSASNPYNAKELVLQISIDNEIELVKLGNRFTLNYAKAYVKLFPQGDYLEILSWDTTPASSFINDSYLFYFNRPFIKKHLRSYGKVKSKLFFPEIKKQIPFPISNAEFPNNIERYLSSTEKINSNDQKIIELAKTIVKGKKDLFSAVHALAVFTHKYLRYDPSTAGQPRSALWILENKNGACGDFSSLFLALTRSLGIPSKYVVGLAYSNYNNLNKFLPHAWVEVYFPEVGWVPFDTTYGEYGHLDATHIKLKESADVDEPSFSYSWVGFGYELVSNNITFDSKVLSEKDEIDAVKMSPYIEIPSVGFESDNRIFLKVKNNLPYYIADDFTLQTPQELQIISEKEQHKILGPNETTFLVWKVHIPSFAKRYAYKLPLQITNSHNYTVQIEFSANSKELSYDLSEQIFEETGELKITPPNFEIDEIKHPKKLIDDEEFNVSFILRKKIKFPINLEVELGLKKWNHLIISDEREIVLGKLNADLLKLEGNDALIPIKITAKNILGETKELTQTLKIPYRKRDIFEKIMDFISSLF